MLEPHALQEQVLEHHATPRLRAQDRRPGVRVREDPGLPARRQLPPSRSHNLKSSSILAIMTNMTNHIESCFGHNMIDTPGAGS